MPKSTSITKRSRSKRRTKESTRAAPYHEVIQHREEDTSSSTPEEKIDLQLKSDEMRCIEDTAQLSKVEGELIPQLLNDEGSLRGSSIGIRSDAISKKRAEVKARFLVARREVEAAEAKLKMARTNLELIELELLELESEVVSVHAEECLRDYDRRVTQEMIIEEPVKETSLVQELAEAIAKLSERWKSCKSVELPHFNGASEEWLAFKRSYVDTAKDFSATQNLARLRRALRGSAREAVKSLLFTAEDPNEVLKGLEARFGRPAALALAELEKLKKLPRVAADPSDICIFASQVKNAVATIKALGKDNYLSSPETVKTVIDKMPSVVKFRWFDFYKKHQDEVLPELILISNFLEEEAAVCADFAPLEEFPEAKSRRPHRAPHEEFWEHKHCGPWRNEVIMKENWRRPHLAPPEESPEQKGSGPHKMYHVRVTHEGSREDANICPACQGNHYLLQCKIFRGASISAKWDMAKKEHLCFKCLRFRHSRIKCRAATCKKCGRWHHTALHSDIPPAKVNEEPQPAIAKEEPPMTTDHRSYDKCPPPCFRAGRRRIQEERCYAPRGRL